MATVPWVAVFECDLYTRVLQREAVGEIMCIPPSGRQTCFTSYGLPPACHALAKVVLRGMYNPVLSWCADSNAVIKDLTDPFFPPEAFRLEPGCFIWPSPEHIGILMPLSSHTASIELLPRGKDYVVPIYWHPDTVLFLNETGMRFTGNGSVRFIYIMLYKVAVPKIRGWRVYVV